MSDIKKILQGAKKSYDSVVKENIELKKYIKNIKQRYQQYQKKNNNRRSMLMEKKNTLDKNNQKNIKKLGTKKKVTVNLKKKRAST